MKTTNPTWYASATLLLAVLTFIAWKPAATVQPIHSFTVSHNDDTSSPRKKDKKDKKEYKAGDLDQAMKDLDKAMVDMDKNMKIDFSKMDREMKLAMDEIKKVDFDKIGRDVAASLKEINWDKTRSEITKAMREAEIKIKEIDTKKIEKELEAVKETLNAEKIKSHIDMESIKKSVETGLANARTGIENAKKELSLLKEFTENLEKDGLINKKKGFTIDIKNGEMSINGARQSKKVNDKYRKYFKNEDYTIRSDDK